MFFVQKLVFRSSLSSRADLDIKIAVCGDYYCLYKGILAMTMYFIADIKLAWAATLALHLSLSMKQKSTTLTLILIKNSLFSIVP